mgnify:CR=1 FL=1
MIPKTIHYFYDDVNIWQKAKKSQVRMCVNSWLKHCPDYKLMLWHDKMPEFQEIINKSAFAKRAYELKLWAFVADYIRCYALYKHGGIYLDTDVELTNNFDKFLKNDFFISTEGDILFGENVPEPAVMGGVAGHKIFKECMKIYESEDIFSIDNFIANVIMKKVLKKQYGFTKLSFKTKKQEEKAVQYFDPMVPNKQLDDYDLYKNECIWQDKSKKVKIYPCEYFCPTWAVFQNKAFTDKTVAIHWNQSTWWDEKKIEMLKNYKCPLEQLEQPVPVATKKPKKNIIKKVFAIDNSSDGIYKVITIFGMNVKIKRKRHA